MLVSNAILKFPEFRCIFGHVLLASLVGREELRVEDDDDWVSWSVSF